MYADGMTNCQFVQINDVVAAANTMTENWVTAQPYIERGETLRPSARTKGWQQRVVMAAMPICYDGEVASPL
jgi:hypothetical protein